MIILGLHFGHDASVSILKDGELLCCVERERFSRVKHAIGLDADFIQMCLRNYKINADDIDYCALTSTQLVEYLLTEPARLDIQLGQTEKHNLPCTMTDYLKCTNENLGELSSGLLESSLHTSAKHYLDLLPDSFKIDGFKNECKFFGAYEHFIDTDVWNNVLTTSQMIDFDYSKFICDDISHGFHMPATVKLDGIKIPAYVCSHHIAHASYSFFSSEYEEAGIITHDGGGIGGGYGCGFYAFGKGNRIYPLTPHHLAVGEIYDFSSVAVGFKLIGGAGKLMGLSAYGSPEFFDNDYVGNFYDSGMKTPHQWIDNAKQRMLELNYDAENFGHADYVLSKASVDFAASTQKLVEVTMLSASQALKSILKGSIGDVSNLCLSGGVALNCPANSKIRSEAGFKNVSALPALIDSGLSAGSALYLYHNVAGMPRNIRKSSPMQAYLGLETSYSESMIDSAIRQFSNNIRFEAVSNPEQSAAECIDNNCVIAWYDGRSEIGPRALGHRSILANPKFASNWKRVNSIKRREDWRPFAPAVLAEDVGNYFDGVAKNSYFMLFNAKVISDTLPAVTHVDGSARVQCVTPESGTIYNLLRCFKAISGCSVLMNTSFNGPGEPVIETPHEAIRFLLNTEIDYLFMGGLKIWKV